MSPWLALLAVLVVAAGVAAYLVSGGSHPPRSCSGASCTTNPGNGGGPGGGSASRAGHRHADTFHVSSTSPASGASDIPSDTKVTVTFASPLASDQPDPTLSPKVEGSWQQVAADELVFTPSSPFVPFRTYTLSIPGGHGGIADASGAHLEGTRTVSFTIANGSRLRLQQLLAELGYLPLSYSGPTPTPLAMTAP
ncbi:MAG: Ig-like domain-containing protein, partial [Acidimicrobiales bacterium]